MPTDDREDRFWGNDVLLAVKDLGSFVRALLPVHLDDGGSLTFGLWLGVHPDTFGRLTEIWWEPEYADIEFTGYLANALEPWPDDIIAQPVTARPVDADAVPYVVDSPDETVGRIVNSEWESEQVLPYFGHLL